MTHQSIIQLVVAYTLVGALIFTVIITCLSLVGWVKFANKSQQNKLFSTLIIELVVIAISFFGNFLQFSPGKVEAIIRQDLSPSEVVEKYYFELNEEDKSDAYELLSTNFRSKKSFAEYRRNFDFWEIGHVKAWPATIEGDRAVVQIDLKCFNIDRVKQEWHGPIELIREDSGWRILTMKDLKKHQP